MEQERARKLHSLCDALFRRADADRAIWESVVRVVMPDIIDASLLRDNEKDGQERPICARARQDCFKLAGAFSSYIFSIGRKFFRFGSWNIDSTDKDMAQDEQYVKMSDIVHAALERSNFHTVLYQVNLDKICTGTGLMLAEMHPRGQLFLFTHVPAGTFAIAENAQHEIDKVVRKFKYTADQIAEAWGTACFTQGMRDAYDNMERRYTQEFVIWHLTMPNTAPNGFPYISIYLSADEKKILSESGYEEFPYMATRFRKFGNDVYGRSPLLTIKKTIRNLMIGKECRALREQRATMPAIAAPADLIGELDLRPGGRTTMPEQYIGRGDVVREFAPMGNYQISTEGEMKDEEEVDMALHIDFLQVISGQDRYMTATEVQQRASEKIMTLTETFTLAQVDMRVLFNRLFALAIREDMIPRDTIPADVIIVEKTADGVKREFIQTPKMVFVGLMAQAMERVQSTSFWDWLARAKQMAIETQDPRWLSCIDVRVATRQEAINMGVESKYFLDWDAETQMLADLQEQQAAQQQAAAEQQQAAAQRDAAQAQNLLNA